MFSTFYLFDKGLTRRQKWTCSPQCQKIAYPKADNTDYILNYTRAITFMGLCERVHHDIIREGDGASLNQDWRVRMVDLYKFNHKN